MTLGKSTEFLALAPKRALILPGGGVRGAYQVGVARALKEAGIDFDFVFGTSIGALNATLIAQGQIGRLEELWGTVRARDIFRLPSASQLGHTLLGHKLGFMDTSPLEAIIRQETSLCRLKASRMKMGLFTTDICSLETRLVTTDDITTEDELVDLLMATSALPIAFPPRQLNGSGQWIDGGLVRNTPIQAAVNMGATEIFVVLLHPSQCSGKAANMLNLIVRCLDIALDASANREIDSLHMYNRLIDEGAEEATGRRKVKINLFQPSLPVNATLLEIDPQRSKTLIAAGYEDALVRLSANRIAIAA